MNIRICDLKANRSTPTAIESSEYYSTKWNPYLNKDMTLIVTSRTFIIATKAMSHVRYDTIVAQDKLPEETVSMDSLGEGRPKIG